MVLRLSDYGSRLVGNGTVAVFRYLAANRHHDKLKRVHDSIWGHGFAALSALEMRLLCAIQRSPPQKRGTVDYDRRLNTPVLADANHYVYVTFDQRLLRDGRVDWWGKLGQDNFVLLVV